MACRNCVDTCNCAIVSTDASISVTGSGSSLNPYDLSVAATTRQMPLTYTVAGTLAVQSGSVPVYFSADATVTNVIIGVGTAPVGGSIVVDVNVNGVSMFTSGGRPTITSGNTSSTQNPPDVPANAVVYDGAYITVDVDAVGAGGTEGSDLVVVVEYVR